MGKYCCVAYLPETKSIFCSQCQVCRHFFFANGSDNDFVTQNGFLNFGTTAYADASGLDYNLQSLAFLVEFDS